MFSDKKFIERVRTLSSTSPRLLLQFREFLGENLVSKRNQIYFSCMRKSVEQSMDRIWKIKKVAMDVKNNAMPWNSFLGGVNSVIEEAGSSFENIQQRTEKARLDLDRLFGVFGHRIDANALKKAQSTKSLILRLVPVFLSRRK